MATTKPYGQRLIPNIIDERARFEPDRAVFSIPSVSQSARLELNDTSSPDVLLPAPIPANAVAQGFTDISARSFADAVDKVAWLLDAEVGKGVSFPSIGYMGPHDIRYALVVLGCIKAGYKAVIISPRNSIEADLALLEATDCNIWLLPKDHPKFFSQIVARRPMKVLTIPEVDEILTSAPVPKYPYDKTFQEASSEPFCVLHTSGSTGNPKPIIWKHSMLATLDATRLLPEHLGRPPWVVVFEEGDWFYSSFPFYHSAAMVMNVLINAFYGTCNVLGPAHIPASLPLIDSLLDHAKVKTWHIVPSIVDEIGETPAIHGKFKDAKMIIASGGPVGYESANKVTPSVRVMNLTGTTEGLFMGSLLVEREDWIYFAFHPYANFDFREIETGVFEHCIVRDESKVDFFQGIFHTFPDIQEMSLKDLYVQHPTKPGLWIYSGRTDDVVVLSSGYKIHPKDTEAVINSHPAVSACLIIGTGHFQASLLVELVNPQERPAEEHQPLLNSIYETVRQATKSKPSYAAITKEHVLFAKPSMPFARTDKSTVKRRMTEAIYESEVEQFYERLEKGDAASFETMVDATSHESTVQDIQRLIITSLSSNEKVGLDDDLFGAGLDSVLAVRVVRCLKSAAERYVKNEAAQSAFAPQFIYLNPSIRQLASAFYNLVHDVKWIHKSPIEMQTEVLEEYRAKYTGGLPQVSGARPRPTARNSNTVILSGSTGSLGSYILEALLRQPNVGKIFCLNRSANGHEKQTRVNKARGLTTSFPLTRVHFQQVDFSQPKFALEDAHYTTLISQTTHIVHCQWPVNFNMSITSFEPHIRGVRHLIDFCLDSKLAPFLFFVSTMATVSHLKDGTDVPEAPVDSLTTVHGGYGASKQACELILKDAYERSGLNGAICRVGQVAGPVLRAEGMWSRQEWVPTIIESSKFLRLLPASLGSMNLVDWIPVDLLGEILVELSAAGVLHHDRKNGFHEVSYELVKTIPVYHAVNPEWALWDDLVPVVKNGLSDADVKAVSWAEWVDALVKSQPLTADVSQNPALKLLDFFEALRRDAEAGLMMPRLETERSEMKSGILAGLKPVGTAWMEAWMKQWAF